MSLTCSRVPHLARAIAEKEKLKLTTALISSANPSRVSPCSHASLRSFSHTHAIHAKRPSAPAPRATNTVSPQRQRPSPPRAPPDEAPVYDPSKDPKRVRRYLQAVSIFGIIIGAYVSYTYASYTNAVKEYNSSPTRLQQNADVADRWCNAKRNFDYEVEGQEKVMWMRSKRKRLIRECYGDVLEVSVGTGRNMDLYDTRPYSEKEDLNYGRDKKNMITSLTFNDQSPVMIERAKKKWYETQAQAKQADRFTGDVRFVEGDAGVPGVVQRPEGGYDTIVQSMGVCSMSQPEEFLRHLGKLVRQPGEEVVNASSSRQRRQEGEDGKGGRIFLLEHGKGYDFWPWQRWLNSYLDNSAAMHADRYGCWFNKEIGTVIENSGLEVERIKRYYFGTVWEIVLRPAPGQAPSEKIGVGILQAAQTNAVKQRSWWPGLWWSQSEENTS